MDLAQALFAQKAPPHRRLVRDNGQGEADPGKPTQRAGGARKELELVGVAEVAAFHDDRSVAVEQYTASASHRLAERKKSSAVA